MEKQGLSMDVNKIPLKQEELIYSLVVEHFEGDKQKASLWMESKNPNFGDVTPLDMIRFGWGNKVLFFIREAKELNDVTVG